MNKAKNQLADQLNTLDVIIEVLDARIPISSRNPMIDQIIGDKPHIIVLNKSDLADSAQSKKWVADFKQRNQFVLSLDAQHHTNIDQLRRNIKRADQMRATKLEERGARHPVSHVAFVGIPNCGKSTLINRLVGSKRAQVGNKPGVTKGQTWMKAAKSSDNIQVLDTPGILWPKFESQTVGYKLAALGAIRDDVFNADDVALFVIEFLKKHYANFLLRFSRLSETDFTNLSNPDFLLAMTAKYGMKDDYERFSLFFLQQLRKGRLGRIDLDLEVDGN